jgi:glycosyltransferase involved in cell wall biosynthesis
LEFLKDASAAAAHRSGGGEADMRVLITVGFLGYFGETDGVTTTYRHLLPFFERLGPDVDVVAYGPEDRVLIQGHVRLFVHRPRLALRVDPRRWIDLGFGATTLARELARVPYSLVQSSTPDPMGRWAQRLARRRGWPFVALYHTALADYAAIRARRAAGRLAGWALGRAMDGWLAGFYGAADLVLAPSESVRADLAARVPAPVAVLGRGVDSRRFRPDRRRRRAGRVRALYVGRVAPEKNLDLLARVFAPMTDVDLTVVGDGPSWDDLRRKLPRAAFTGRLVGDALAQEYADADFFVFPSRTDTLGNVVLEAMASGLPVVVTDSLGPKELVRHGETGFVAGSDEEFAGSVRTLVGDGGRREVMGLTARRFAETRSWRAIFEQLLGYHDQVRRRNSSVPPPAPVARPCRPSSRPLCVLDISEFFGEASGGVKTYLTHKAGYVEAHADLRQVLVVPGPIDACHDSPRVRWYRLRGPRIPGQPSYRLLFDRRRIREIVERERPDVVEVGSHFLAPWLVAESARRTGALVVWFCHSNLPTILAPYPTSAWLRRQAAGLGRGYFRRLGRSCSATLAPSDAVAEELERMGVANVARVSLGVDVQGFDPARAGRRLETRCRHGLPVRPFALYAGRITREKGVDLLLEAWTRVEAETGAHLVLVGHGPDEARLRARCRVRSVHWRSYLADREQLADLMAAADLYVAPSVVETFGLAAIEAMACGTPVLCADRGGVAEHVRRSGAGALFASGSAASLAEKAIQLLRSSPTPVRGGHDYVARQLSWPSAFDRIFGVYWRVLAGGQG